MHEYDEEEDDSSNAGDGEKDLEPGTDDEGFEDSSGGVKMEKEAVESEDEKEEEALKEEVNMEEVEQEIMELADKAVEERQTAVLDLDEWIAEYGFDTQKSLYCQLTLSVSCSLNWFYLHSCKMNVLFLFTGASESKEG